MDHLRNIKIEPEECFVKAKKKRTYNKRMREEIARYAIETSIGLASKRFSDELGFLVRHSTVTRMKDSYLKAKHQVNTRAEKPKNYKYDPCIREEIARYAMRHGTGVAARQFTVDLGHPVTYSTVARMRESYAKKYKIEDDAPNKQEDFDDYE